MIIALFATDENGGMGVGGVMPWPRNREDMMWFKKTTENKIVVMGRKTWDSSDMPTPLPNRTNVLVTSNFIDREDILQISGNLCTALVSISLMMQDDVFVIGGPDILMQALPVIEKAYITQIPGSYFCDATIDLTEFLKKFELINTNKLATCEIKEYAAVS